MSDQISVSKRSTKALDRLNSQNKKYILYSFICQGIFHISQGNSTHHQYSIFHCDYKSYHIFTPNLLYQQFSIVLY